MERNWVLVGGGAAERAVMGVVDRDSKWTGVEPAAYSQRACSVAPRERGARPLPQYATVSTGWSAMPLAAEFLSPLPDEWRLHLVPNGWEVEPYSRVRCPAPIRPSSHDAFPRVCIKAVDPYHVHTHPAPSAHRLLWRGKRYAPVLGKTKEPASVGTGWLRASMVYHEPGFSRNVFVCN